jgi:hypothetical protein
MLDPTAPNPIRQRLEREIDPARERRSVLAAVGVALVLGMVAVWGCILRVISGQANPAGSLIFFVALAAAPIFPMAAAVLSAGMAHRDIHGQDYDLLRLTRVAGQTVVDGYVRGIAARLRSLRAFGYALLPPLGIGINYFIIPLWIDFYSAGAAQPSQRLFRIVAAVLSTGIVAFSIGAIFAYLFHAAFYLATISGISAAFQFRKNNTPTPLAASVACMALVMGCVLFTCLAFAAQTVTVLPLSPVIAAGVCVTLLLLMLLPSITAWALESYLVRLLERMH